MKSSLKTFLAGKNPYGDNNNVKLVGSQWLRDAVNESGIGTFSDRDEIWCVDVLDDGTAITYCVM